MLENLLRFPRTHFVRRLLAEIGGAFESSASTDIDSIAIHLDVTIAKEETQPIPIFSKKFRIVVTLIGYLTSTLLFILNSENCGTSVVQVETNGSFQSTAQVRPVDIYSMFVHQQSQGISR